MANIHHCRQLQHRRRHYVVKQYYLRFTNSDFDQRDLFKGFIVELFQPVFNRGAGKSLILSRDGKFRPPLSENHFPFSTVQLFKECHDLLILNLQSNGTERSHAVDTIFLSTLFQ